MAFPFSLKFRLEARNDLLKEAPNILASEMRGGLQAVGHRLRTSAEVRMRRDTGAEVKSLTEIVTGRGLEYNLVVFSTLLRAFVDAYGMRPGTHVPYGKGSRLYLWAQRKVKIGPSKKLKGRSTPYAGAGPHRMFRAGTGYNRITRVKGIGRITKGSKIKGNARIRAKGADASRLAYFTAKGILEHGITASHWNMQALEANRSRIIQEMQNAMLRAVGRIKRG